MELQTAISFVAGSSLGGGFGSVVSWTPLACVLPTGFRIAVWTQFAFVLLAVPLAVAVAVASRVFALWFWGRSHTTTRQVTVWKSWQASFPVAFAIIAYSLFWSVLQAGIMGGSTRWNPISGTTTFLADMSVSVNTKGNYALRVTSLTVLALLG